MIKKLQKMMVAVIAAALLLSSVAFAHRVKSCVTTVDWKVDGTIQVTHRLHYHDAAEVLRVLKPSSGDGSKETLFELNGIARMAHYMGKDFDLSVGGQKVTLSPIGGEVEGDYFYLYFESDKKMPGTSFDVRSDIFRSDYPSQLNSVIAQRGTQEQTVVLTKKGQIKTVGF